MKYVILLAITLFAFNINANPPVEGKDYVIVAGEQSLYRGGKVNVREFFLYGCPHCYDFQPIFTRWLGRRGEEVELELYPLVLAPSWFPFYGKTTDRARMYYSLAQMGIHNLHSLTFEAIHELNMDLSDEDEIAEFVQSQGVNREEFLRNYNSSLTNNLLKTSDTLRKEYSISYTPTIVVDGKYMTNFELADNNSARLMAIVDSLVNKTQAEKH